MELPSSLSLIFSQKIATKWLLTLYQTITLAVLALKRSYLKWESVNIRYGEVYSVDRWTEVIIGCCLYYTFSLFFNTVNNLAYLICVLLMYRLLCKTSLRF